MFADLVLKNRSFRAFDASRAVTRDELLTLVDLARLTASSANRQPLKYAVVHEAQQVEAVLALTRWAAALPQLHLPPEGRHPTAFIVICHDERICEALPGYLKDVGIAAQTILLAAAEKDLGGCMIGSFNPEELSKLLSLPAEVKPQLVIALGKPDEEVCLTDVPADGKTAYFRDESGVHYVPKRSLEDIVI